MTTLDGFRLPLKPGTKVYLERLEARWQSAYTLHEPPVVVADMVPGRVERDGMTALFPWDNGKPLIKHLTQCRFSKNFIRLD